MEHKKHEPKIYLICGKARHGKDTTGSYIRAWYQSHGIKSFDTDFAYYIKSYAKASTDWDGTDETKPRAFLQQLGQEIIRKELGNLFLAKRLQEDILVLSYFYDVFTITDGRMVAEIDYIKKQYKNVYVISVVRPNFMSELTSKEQEHKTETELDNYSGYDTVIMNDGTLDDLKHRIYNLLEEVAYEN